MAEGYTKLVGSPNEVEVGQKVKVVPVVPKKMAELAPPDPKILTVESVDEHSIGTSIGNISIPAKAPLKFKVYRGAKKRGRTAKKRDGGRRHTRRK